MSDGHGFSRRDFMRDAALTLAMAAASGIEELRADPAPEPPKGPPVGCGVIGLGPQGSALLHVLARQEGVPIAAICDTYQPIIKRAQEIAPKAATYSDYRQLLDDKKVEAVFVATPSHLHREIALAA